MKVLIAIYHRFELWRAPEWFRDRFARDFPDHEFVRIPTLDTLAEAIADADIMLGYLINAEQFARAKKLKLIHTTTAAVHQLMFPELIASDVRIANAAAVHGPVVAEHAIGMVFALAKSLPAAMAYQQKHQWSQSELWREGPRPREVNGSTLGVVGLGEIGKEAVRLGKLLGMRVIAIREHPDRGSEAADEVLPTTHLDRLLAESDFVLLCAPLTEKTAALFDAEAFAKMKPGSSFINVSRGPLVDDAALIAALESRHLSGAALDVFTQEPLPSDSPLWSAPNLLITPHSAALTDRMWERHYQYMAENLRRFFRGERLLSEIDKRRGY